MDAKQVTHVYRKYKFSQGHVVQPKVRSRIKFRTKEKLSEIDKLKADKWILRLPDIKEPSPICI